MSYQMKAYLFRDKDPVIDQLRTMVEDQYGMKLSGKSLKNIENKGGPRTGTMRGWFFGKVKRPQSATVEGCGHALGYQRKWVKLNGKSR